MNLYAIAAVDSQFGMGLNNSIPWHNKADLKNFSRLTSDQHLLMGRKTWESLPETPNGKLPGRTLHVLSRSPNSILKDDRTLTYPNLEIALKSIQEIETLWIIGGANLFHQLIDFADKIYLSRVKGSFGCDVFFPQLTNRKIRASQYLDENCLLEIYT